MFPGDMGAAGLTTYVRNKEEKGLKPSRAHGSAGTLAIKITFLFYLTRSLLDLMHFISNLLEE